RLAILQSEAITGPTPADLLDLLRFRSRASTVAAPASPEARALADSAVDALRRLIEDTPGYRGFLEQESAIDPIRDRPDVRALLARPSGPPGPHAPGRLASPTHPSAAND